MLTKVAIVEDSREVRECWAEIVNSTPGYRCVCSCGSGEAALREIPPAAPAVVLMDLLLPNMSGIECTARLKLQLPDVQILILTVSEDTDLIFKALQAGANGYLLKRSSPGAVIAAIGDVLHGGAPMSSEVARKIVESLRRPVVEHESAYQLSRREEEILDRLCKGYSNKEIASDLSISFDTVRTHLKKIYEKLHVRSRTEAVIRYLNPGDASFRTSPARIHCQNHSIE